MSKCSFNFELPIEAISLMTMAIRAVEEQGGTTTSQDSGVWFSVPTPAGVVDGTYTVLAKRKINISVSNKPDAIPCSVIRDRLVDYLTEAVKIYARLSRVRADTPPSTSRQPGSGSST
jgi:hypothetical protein